MCIGMHVQTFFTGGGEHDQKFGLEEESLKNTEPPGLVLLIA